MNATLASWNSAGADRALDAMLACCGARRWADAMVSLRPIATVQELSQAADRAWAAMEEPDWKEAFACHPRIGERKPAHTASQLLGQASGQASTWSHQEQSAVAETAQGVLDRLAEGNADYERRFGFTYIVCAAGKSAEEMLEILNRRLASERECEVREAAEQQRQIMQLRLGKWLAR